MKKYLVTSVFVFFFTCSAFSQSTEIRPGTVLPQMTTAQRTGIASPTNGMLVFDTNTQSYWYRQSSTWAELPQAGSTSNYWQLNGVGGNEIKNTNSGGLWSANPAGLTSVSDNVSNPPSAPVNGDGTRLMWVPNRSAFRVGTVTNSTKSWNADSIGLYSFASGYNAKAKGRFAVAMGNNTQASGFSSTAMGSGNASGYASTAIGYITNAGGNYSTALGNNTKATGSVSTAMGLNTVASGSASTAMGNGTNATGDYSTAMGYSTEASKATSTAMGNSTVASGSSSSAMGYFTVASGSSSTAMGDYSEASGKISTAMGLNTLATGFGSTAMGIYTKATGNFTTAMGTKTSINYQEGSFTIGDYVSGSDDSLFSTSPNQFLARFENGYYLFTDNNLSSATKYGVFMNNRANSWSSISDSTKKERFLSYDPQKVLNSVAAMRVGTWNYKGDDRPEGRHWGVMAQDFYHHFGTDKYGTIGSDTLIATADFDGVSFAAIKAIELRTRELQKENEKLKKENQLFRNELAAKDEKYLQLFADLKAEITVMKLNANSAE